MTKPITPKQVVSPEVPAVVVDVFNELIKRNWDGRLAVIKSDSVHIKIGPLSHRYIEWRDYLAIKLFYQRVGWKVDYDEATFTFSIEDQDIAGYVVIVQDDGTSRMAVLWQRIRGEGQ